MRSRLTRTRYWSINSVKVYQLVGTPSTPSSSTTLTSAVPQSSVFGPGMGTNSSTRTTAPAAAATQAANLASVGTFTFLGCASSSSSFSTFTQVDNSINMSVDRCTSECANFNYAGIFNSFVHSHSLPAASIHPFNLIKTKQILLLREHLRLLYELQFQFWPKHLHQPLSWKSRPTLWRLKLAATPRTSALPLDPPIPLPEHRRHQRCPLRRRLRKHQRPSLRRARLCRFRLWYGRWRQHACCYHQYVPCHLLFPPLPYASPFPSPIPQLTPRLPTATYLDTCPTCPNGLTAIALTTTLPHCGCVGGMPSLAPPALPMATVTKACSACAGGTVAVTVPYAVAYTPPPAAAVTYTAPKPPSNATASVVLFLGAASRGEVGAGWVMGIMAALVLVAAGWL